MADLKSILKHDIDRTIDGVIKADDDSHIRIEVEEYVLTKEIQKHLNRLVEGYKASIESFKRGETYPFNGVWISGYFGSGKSHLLKMLAYILNNDSEKESELAQLFLPKIKDTIFQADFRNILKTPAQSILFNIDQEAIASPQESESALLYIFESVFNRHCGYFPTNRGVAEFELHLDEQGQYDQFKTDYLKITGKPWEDRRKAAFGLARNELIKVLEESKGMTANDAIALIDNYKNGSHLTIDSFVQRIKIWLDSKASPEFRLNFFVDEVGQFIAGKTRLMLNLQTLAETMGTVCQGRVWIFVTSQEDLTSVVGLTDKKQTQDFSKINARYHFKIALNSTDVQEVIQKRLLDKTSEGESALGDLYMKEQETFRTLFRLGDGGFDIRFRSKEEFILSYPFQAYQYNLLQESLKTLSEHNAFRGQHISRGERSMLEIFQDVSKQLKNRELFNWATFDLMFEGIRQTLNTSLVGAISIAEKNLDGNVLAVRLLKILLMVKYVRTFKATQNHLKILLIENTDQDLSALDRGIGEALSLLEYQTFIQRNGMEYSYLTNEEKDIEEEIKQVDISYDELRKFLGDMVFSEIFKVNNKLRDSETKEDYMFSRMVDGVVISNKLSDLSIHIVSQEHQNYDDRSVLISQSMGKKELTIVLPAERTFQNDLRLYYQTDHYCRQQLGHEQREIIQAIIAAKQHQNGDRKTQLRNKLTQMIGQADFYVLGDQINLNPTDPQSRLNEGFQRLLKQAYPKLRFLGNHHYTEGDIKAILYPDDSSALFGGDASSMDEAEKEMLNIIRIKHGQNAIPSLKNIMDEFSTGQFGWYSMAILSIMAKLFNRDSIELSQGNKVKSRDDVFALFSSNRDYEQVRVRPAAVVSQDALNGLKSLYLELFHHPLEGSNARESAQFFKETLNGCYQKAQLWKSQSHDLSFLHHVSFTYLEEVLGHENEWFLTSRTEYAPSLTSFFKEDWEPLSAFMEGSQKDLWLTQKEFVTTHRDNLTELGLTVDLLDLEALLEQEPYKNGNLRTLKKAVDKVKSTLDEALSKQKSTSRIYIEKLIDELQGAESYQKIGLEKQEYVIKPLEDLLESLEPQTQLSVIRDMAQTRGTKGKQEAQRKIQEILKPDEEIFFASDAEKRVPFNKGTLETAKDVKSYAKSLEDHYLGLIEQEKRITL
jgi:energy-coupling factor transporter ATP-binding protein EcfA2